MLTLPDVSFWQDDPTTPLGIDFARMKQQSSSVIIRAGQNLWADNEFAISWANAKKAGLLRGAYWFYDSRADPKKQAQLWIVTLNGDLGELPLWCDFEDQYGGAYGTWKYWYDFIEELKRLVPGKQIGIYTGYYYWLEKTASASPASKDYFGQYPLWIARYNATDPLVPYPWEDWTLWQYTDNGDGTLYGVESKNIDLNYFNGDEVKFKETFNLVDWVPNDDEQENNQMLIAKYNCVTRASVKVRTAPNTANTANDSMLMGTAFQISDIVQDSLDPSNTSKKWGLIFGGKYDGMYTALEYPGNIVPISTYTLIPGTDPEPPPPTGNVFPDFFIMELPTGERARFVFEVVLE